MSSRIAIGIVALTIVLAALAAVAAYLFEAVTPALALGAVAAILAALAFIVAGVALERQQGVISEQTSLAVMLDRSLVRLGRRIDEQEVKFAAARALGARGRIGDDAPALPAADVRAMAKPAPRTAMEVADTKPEPAERERHKARFLPPADTTTVAYSGRNGKATPSEFGPDFEIALEPVVAIPSGNVTAYRVFAGFPQADGSFAHVTETPAGYWADKGAAFGEALAGAAAATAARHFDAAGDARLYMPVPQALIDDEQAAKALAQRYAGDPVMARTVIATLRASFVDRGGEAVAGRIMALTRSGATVALELDEPATGIDALASRFEAAAVLARADLFPPDSASGWLGPLMDETGALVIATGVASESDVIAIMDLNVGHMSGSLFAEPKHLKGSEATVADG